MSLAGWARAPARNQLKNSIFKLRFRTRLALAMFAITAFTSGILTFAYVQYVRKIKGYVAGLTSDLVQITQVAQADMPPGATRKEALSAYQKELQDAGLSSISVVDPSGEVVASTSPGQVGKRILLRRRRWMKPVPIQISAQLHDVNIEPSVIEKQYNIRFPITQGDKVLGYALIGGEMDQVGQFMRRLYLVRLVWILCTMLAGMSLVVYLAFRFTKPIDLLMDASQQVARGNLYVTLPANSSDEMGRLAQTFNQMVERLRENRKLQERLNEAEKASFVARFAATVAHEVRNSLNFMNLSIDQLRAKRVRGDDALSRELQRNMSNMKDEISRLNRLVNDFLAIGRERPPALAPLELPAAVGQALTLIEKQSHQQEIRVVSDIPPDLPVLQADAEQLRTCFLNILTNSLQAMPEGGRIQVSARRVANGDRIELRFADTGPGIPPADRERIFAPYYSTKPTGFGLGLAITKKIIEDHGGSVYVTDAQPRGAIIVLELPVAPAAVADSPAIPAPTAA